MQGRGHAHGQGRAWKFRRKRDEGESRGCHSEWHHTMATAEGPPPMALGNMGLTGAAGVPGSLTLRVVEPALSNMPIGLAGSEPSRPSECALRWCFL